MGYSKYRPGIGSTLLSRECLGRTRRRSHPDPLSQSLLPMGKRGACGHGKVLWSALVQAIPLLRQNVCCQTRRPPPGEGAAWTVGSSREWPCPCLPLMSTYDLIISSGVLKSSETSTAGFVFTSHCHLVSQLPAVFSVSSSGTSPQDSVSLVALGLVVSTANALGTGGTHVHLGTSCAQLEDGLWNVCSWAPLSLQTPVSQSRSYQQGRAWLGAGSRV